MTVSLNPQSQPITLQPKAPQVKPLLDEEATNLFQTKIAEDAGDNLATTIKGLIGGGIGGGIGTATSLVYLGTVKSLEHGGAAELAKLAKPLAGQSAQLVVLGVSTGAIIGAVAANHAKTPAYALAGAGAIGAIIGGAITSGGSVKSMVAGAVLMAGLTGASAYLGTHVANNTDILTPKK